MKSLKKQLNAELDLLTPRLSDDVLSTPIISNQVSNKSFNKKFIPIASCAMACALVIGAVALVSHLNGKPQNYTFMMVDVNPKASFASDETGKTVKVSATNQDADVVLQDEVFYQSLIGIDLKESIKIYIDKVAQLGYLNLNEKGEIVKVSSLEDSETLKDVEIILQDYFKEKGSYTLVLQDIMDRVSFCSQNGIENSSHLTTIYKDFIQQETYYTKKEASVLSPKALSEHYEENILYKGVKDYLHFITNEKLLEIENNEQLLNELVNLNEQIMEHQDNPLTLFKDYWWVKSLHYTDYTEPFEFLMQSMEEKLEEYAHTYRYGIEISSYAELKMIYSHYELISMDTIREILKNFSDVIFSKNANYLLNILNDIGVEIQKFTELLVVPQTIEEYVSKTLTSMEYKAKQLFLTSKESYLTKRDTISDNDYKNYMDSIIEIYGSLQNYWNEKK